jgi:hypothetical protein
MYDNVISLIRDDAGAEVDVSIVDTDNGTTVRRYRSGANVWELTISTSETKEVKGVLSDRILVRVDRYYPSTAFTDTQIPLKCSAYLVLVIPREAANAGAAVPLEPAHALISFLIGTADLGAGSAADQDLATNLSRLVSGET